jgi:hypothetical protein
MPAMHGLHFGRAIAKFGYLVVVAAAAGVIYLVRRFRR